MHIPNKPARRLLCAAALLLALARAAAAPAVFNGRLTDEEKRTLDSGSVLIRNIRSTKELSMASPNAGAQKVLETIRALKPAYIAEIIRVYPYAGNEGFKEAFKEMVMDVTSYVGIPYYSEHTKEWYDLYSSADVKESRDDGATAYVLADLEMSPFGVINTQIDAQMAADYFYYESTNLNKLRYHDRFNAVGPQKMKSVLCVFRAGDQWVLYGVGAVNAPSVFFLRERAETSFRNRIKAFCAYFFDKM